MSTKNESEKVQLDFCAVTSKQKKDFGLFSEYSAESLHNWACSVVFSSSITKYKKTSMSLDSRLNGDIFSRCILCVIFFDLGLGSKYWE